MAAWRSSADSSFAAQVHAAGWSFRYQPSPTEKKEIYRAFCGASAHHAAAVVGSPRDDHTNSRPCRGPKSGGRECCTAQSAEALPLASAQADTTPALTLNGMSRGSCCDHASAAVGSFFAHSAAAARSVLVFSSPFGNCCAFWTSGGA